VVDRNGVPLPIILSGANRHDSMVMAQVVDAIHPRQANTLNSSAALAALRKPFQVAEQNSSPGLGFEAPEHSL